MPTTRQRKPSAALRITFERLTVEERLRIVTGRLALLASMFEACSASYDRLGAEGLSAGACAAVAEICTASQAHLETIRVALPIAALDLELPL